MSDNQRDHESLSKMGLYQSYLEQYLKHRDGTKIDVKVFVEKMVQADLLVRSNKDSTEREIRARAKRLLMEALWVIKDVELLDGRPTTRPPFNAEYALYLFLKKHEREVVIGDLVESYGQILRRFNKRHADIWFYKQVFGSLWPLVRRAVLRIGALVWLGRILRRLIS